jgi:Flp pilus assembly protein TadG
MKLIPDIRKQKQRGATMILFTFLMILVIVPAVGLAVDGAIVMWEKARLSASVDAAALAAGRSLSVGQDLPSQTASAINMAQTYFQANFQPGQMGTSVVNGQPIVTVAQTNSVTRTVTIQASVNVPLCFLRLIGFTTASLQASGQASRRDVNVILVLDRSGSMYYSGSCNPMIAAAQSFTNMFVDGRDQLGLITFQTTANVDFAPSQTFKAGINQQLSQLVCSGGTNSAWGLSLAYDQIKQVGWPGALNVVVFFSDGYPTALRYTNTNKVSAALPTRNQTADNGDYRYDVDSYNQEVAMSPSPCTSSAISGVLTLPGQSPDPTGYTWGVLKDTQYPINATDGSQSDSSHLVPAGCTYNNPPSGYEGYGIYFMRNDIAYIPQQDYYGNRTANTLNPRGPQPFRLTVLFPQDSNHVYGGQLRPDVPQNLVNTAFNAADNAAYSIRNDTTYNPIIYTIGLGSDVDHDFMERLANDPRASSYDTTKPAGRYYYTPTATQLAAIFQQIASQVLRISQ